MEMFQLSKEVVGFVDESLVKFSLEQNDLDKSTFCKKLLYNCSTSVKM